MELISLIFPRKYSYPHITTWYYVFFSFFIYDWSYIIPPVNISSSDALIGIFSIFCDIVKYFRSVWRISKSLWWNMITHFSFIVFLVFDPFFIISAKTSPKISDMVPCGFWNPFIELVVSKCIHIMTVINYFLGIRISATSFFRARSMARYFHQSSTTTGIHTRRRNSITSFISGSILSGICGLFCITCMN